jgi:hypothetical protein
MYGYVKVRYVQVCSVFTGMYGGVHGTTDKGTKAHAHSKECTGKYVRVSMYG